jgi:hypothetical protein
MIGKMDLQDSEYIHIGLFDDKLENVRNSVLDINIDEDIFTRKEKIEGTDAAIMLNELLKNVYLVSMYYKYHVTDETVPIFEFARNNLALADKKASDAIDIFS